MQTVAEVLSQEHISAQAKKQINHQNKIKKYNVVYSFVCPNCMREMMADLTEDDLKILFCGDEKLTGILCPHCRIVFEVSLGDEFDDLPPKVVEKNVTIDAIKTKIQDLKIATRDISDYKKMKFIKDKIKEIEAYLREIS